ncbi:hypothetical protein PPYR_05319 [Photinus pyralis]|uniref:Uncharacterized protein n=1 Tax=Photinus pyralis TaxID=7054 RepID=A0A5N4AUB2_PHOPY|nr:uncharacterized protein LOC116166118 [Photinus pyralis]KAB0800965.1 hypothetical protein PPYR_05319 [Photinus pyralis]
MEIRIVVFLMAAGLAYGSVIYSSNLNSALVNFKQLGGNFAYSSFEFPTYLGPTVLRQVIGQYPFYPPQQVLYPGYPIFTYPGLPIQGPVSPPFITQQKPPSSGSPSQVIIDEDTVAIDSA